MNKQIKNNIDYMLYDYEKRFTFRTEETKKTFLTVIEKADEINWSIKNIKIA